MGLLTVSAVFLVMGFILPMLQAWEGAPKAVALPVKAYFAVFDSTRNGFFRGFFYVAVGAVLGMRHERLGKLSFGGIAAGAVFGLLGCIFVANSAHLPFCACASICLFLLSVRRCGSGLKPHVAARNASTIIYLVHMVFAVVFVYGICGGLNPDLAANDYSKPLLFLFSLAGSCLTAAIVMPLAKKAPVLKKVFGI